MKIRLKELRKNKGEIRNEPNELFDRSLSSCKKFILLFAAIYLRRLRKEKKLRHKLEKELQLESKKRSYFEDAINNLRE